MPDLLRDVLTVVAGIATGVLSGSFGVGGAVISTPAIRALGVPALVAVGTTLPSILPSAVTGSLRYARDRLVDVRAAAWTSAAGVAASVGGSLASHAVPGDGHLLMLATAALLAFSAWRMSRPPAPVAGADGPGSSVAPPPHRPPAALLVGLGVAAGGLSGLLGVGGGIVLVPAFTELAKLPLKVAIATSLVCVGLFALPGTVTHALLGGIDWRVALLLTVGVIPGARLGAALTMRAGDRRLRTTVAVFFGLIAVLYGTGEIAALVAG